MNRFSWVLVLIVSAGLAAGMVLMGLWQLRVYERQGANVAVQRAAEPPLPLSEVAPPGGKVRDGYGRSVTFAGQYEAQHQILVADPDGTDRYRVVTLLRQDDGSAVAVARGIVTETSAAPPTGRQEQVGVLLPSEPAPEQNPGEATTSVRVTQLAQQWPGPLIDGFVTLSAADATAQGLEPAQARLPEARGRLRNAAYAGQWWLFAAFTVVMAVRMARDLRLDAAEVPSDAP
jgi:cytochrome oxidase assembly protein ShyY1